MNFSLATDPISSLQDRARAEPKARARSRPEFTTIEDEGGHWAIALSINK